MDKILAAFEVETLRRCYALARGERGWLVVLFALGLSSAVLEALGLSFLIPLTALAIQGEITTEVPVIGPLLGVLETHVALTPLLMVGLIVGLFTLGLIVSLANGFVSTFVGNRFGHTMRMAVFSQVLQQPLVEIESMPSGKVMNNLATETYRACDAVFLMVYVAVTAVSIGVLLAFLLMLSPFYSAVLMVLTGVMAAIVHLATQTIRELGRASLSAHEGFTRYVWDTINGLRVVRGFGHDGYEGARFKDRSDTLRTVYNRLGVLQSLVSPLYRIMSVLSIGTILGLAFWRGDEVSVLAGFLAIAYRLQPRFNGLLSAFVKLRGLEASVAEIWHAVTPAPPQAREEAGFGGLRAAIEFDRVSVRYPLAERLALSDVSCRIERGRVTAVAGYSGAGKSTLVALLLRFMEPEHGRILVDGVALSDIAPKLWLRRTAFVEHDAHVFMATVAENIAYGDLTAGRAQIERAARAARAHEFIVELPKGYDTEVGEDGIRLSQGQRQRVALARALLRQTDLLILDEATNALDRPTERALREAVEACSKDRAVVIIAHRRETIESADQVIVLDRGRVVETGTPQALAARGGVYARLYREAPVIEDAL